VLAAQIELTETGTLGAHSEGNIDMLVRLAELGYDLREVPNKMLDSNVTMPPDGVRWAKARGVWQQLPRFGGRLLEARQESPATRQGHTGCVCPVATYDWPKSEQDPPLQLGHPQHQHCWPLASTGV